MAFVLFFLYITIYAEQLTIMPFFSQKGDPKSLKRVLSDLSRRAIVGAEH